VIAKARVGRPGAGLVKPVGRVDLTNKKPGLQKQDQVKPAISAEQADEKKKKEASVEEESTMSSSKAPVDEDKPDSTSEIVEKQETALDEFAPELQEDSSTVHKVSAPAAESQHPRSSSDPQASTSPSLPESFSSLSIAKENGSISPPPSDVPDMTSESEEDSRDIDEAPSEKPSSPAQSFQRSLAPSPSPPQEEKVKIQVNGEQVDDAPMLKEEETAKSFSQWGSREGGITIPQPPRSVSPAASSPGLAGQKKVPMWVI